MKKFKPLLVNLTILVLISLISAALVFVCQKMLTSVIAINDSAKIEQIKMHEKLSKSKDEENELRRKIVKYQEIDAKGFIGNEHRLDWIEQIKSIKQNRKLIEVQYELQPQQIIDTSLISGNVSSVEFMTSIMKLKLLLLHEGDLINFLADLSKMDAFIRVKQCNVERLNVPVKNAQLRADCIIEWITLRKKR